MPELPHEPHPKFDISCKGCKHWLAHKAEKVALVSQPNGQTMGVPFAAAQKQATEQGQLGAFLEQQTYTTAADCTRFPQWSKTSANHWCDEYEGKVHTRAYFTGSVQAS